jgi:hypothetical protein
MHFEFIAALLPSRQNAFDILLARDVLRFFHKSACPASARALISAA